MQLQLQLSRLAGEPRWHRLPLPTVTTGRLARLQAKKKKKGEKFKRARLLHVTENAAFEMGMIKTVGVRQTRTPGPGVSLPRLFMLHVAAY